MRVSYVNFTSLAIVAYRGHTRLRSTYHTILFTFGFL
nr:MAG TPA: hypothetical protein [Caudoviricetes sp.]